MLSNRYAALAAAIMLLLTALGNATVMLVVSSLMLVAGLFLFKQATVLKVTVVAGVAAVATVLLTRFFM